MNEDWESRDGWDGATWAEMFSGPDDDEIESQQHNNYRRSIDDDDAINTHLQNHDIYPDEDINALDCSVDIPTRQLSATQHPRIRGARYDINNKDEVNAFLKYANRVGATILKICQNKLEFDDCSDDCDSKKFNIYSIYAESKDNVNLNYYRTGIKYAEGERQRVISNYLGWMHVDQIAFQHKRPPTAIWSVLIKAGCAFYERAFYKNPDEENVEVDQVEIQRNGYKTCQAIRESILTGRCSALPSTPLKLEWPGPTGDGYFYLRELSNKDQISVVIFVASAISLDSAFELSQKLNLQYLSYCIARQQGEIERALVVLNAAPQGLIENLQEIRRDIQFYFRLEAIEAIKNPLEIWCNNKAYRFDVTLNQQKVYESNARRFLFLYKICAATRGFEASGDVLFVVAAICRDYESIKLLAAEGNWLAKWHIHERKRVDSAVQSSDDIDAGSNSLLKDRSESISFHRIFEEIQSELPSNWHIAQDFGNRILTQDELTDKKEMEYMALLDRAIENSEINQRLGEIDNYYDSLGYMG